MRKSVVVSHRRGGYAEASSLLIIAVVIFALVLSGPSTVVKERDELSNNKALDTAGTILIRGHSKRSLTVMKLSLHFQSRGRPVHYLRLKGLTWKTDLKQKLARKPDEAVLIIEIDELLASGLPEVTEVIQLLKELLSQNKSFTLDLCPQADSEGCLDGDLPALSDKQSTLSMKTMCLKPRKVGQLIQALSITEDLACMGEDQQVLRGHRTHIWPGHFSDENVLLNSAKTGNAKNNNLFTVCSYFARERERKTLQYNVNWSSNYAKTFLPNPLNMIYRLYLHMTRQVIKGLVNLEHKVISLYKVVLFNSHFFPFFFFFFLITGMIFFSIKFM